MQIIREDKEKKIIKEIITTTPVMINNPQTGILKGLFEMQMAIIPSAYIEFECTLEHAKEFLSKHTKMIQV